MKKNILITGASGFIGSFLVEDAIKKNYETFAGIRTTSSKKYLTHPKINFLELAFNDEISLNNSFQNFSNQFGSFDYIIHTAGLTKAKNNSEYFESNFENTKRFVEALQRNNLVPEKFIFISSLASFGPGKDNNPITLQHIKQPLSAYGKSKLKVEQFLYNTKNFPFIIINPTTVYGPREKDLLLLLKTIEKNLEVYLGNANQLLSFVHVQDLCDATFLAMESAAVNQNFLVSDLQIYTSKIFNRLAKESLNKKTISLTFPHYLVKALAALAETGGRISGKVPILNRERLKEFEALNWSVDCSELVNLGYAPRFDLKEGLKHTIDWYKEQQWLKN